MAAGVFGKQRPLIVFCVSLRKNKPYVWISQEKLFVISAIQPNLGILQGIILQYMALFSIFVEYRIARHSLRVLFCLASLMGAFAMYALQFNHSTIRKRTVSRYSQ